MANCSLTKKRIPCAANRPCVGHHQKYESHTPLFVCYHAVTALTERFCQNAKIRPTLGWRRRRPVASAEPRGRARQEQLVGGQFGSASRKPCTRAPSFGPRPDVAVRSLPPRTRLRFSSLLGDAILFLDLHHGIPAATSA